MIPHRVIWKADNGTIVTRAFPSKDKADAFAIPYPDAKVQPVNEVVIQRVTKEQSTLHKRKFGG